MATANSPGASSNNNADSDVEDTNPNLIFQLIIAIDFLYLLLSPVPLPSASSASLVTPLQALLWAPSSATFFFPIALTSWLVSAHGTLYRDFYFLFWFTTQLQILSRVHSLVVCFLKRLRGKDGVINAGVAGCCTGLALSFPGALLQSCLTFGAFSFIIERLNK